METFSFELFMTTPKCLSLDRISDKLFQVGCDDATISLQNKMLIISFDREAITLEKAIVSAISDVESAKLGISFIRTNLLTENKKMFKVIFLDIDGVLVTGRSLERPCRQFFSPEGQNMYMQRLDKVAVQNLNALLKLTKAKIIISSTWRRIFLLNLIESHFLKEGIELDEHVIIDRTSSRGNRTSQIQESIELYRNSIESYVILDDADIDERLAKNHVKTNFYNGFSVYDLAKAVKILYSE